MSLLLEDAIDEASSTEERVQALQALWAANGELVFPYGWRAFWFGILSGLALGITFYAGRRGDWIGEVVFVIIMIAALAWAVLNVHQVRFTRSHILVVPLFGGRRFSRWLAYSDVASVHPLRPKGGDSAIAVRLLLRDGSLIQLNKHEIGRFNDLLHLLRKLYAEPAPVEGTMVFKFNWQPLVQLAGLPALALYFTYSLNDSPFVWPVTVAAVVFWAWLIQQALNARHVEVHRDALAFVKPYSSASSMQVRFAEVASYTPILSRSPWALMFNWRRDAVKGIVALRDGRKIPLKAEFIHDFDILHAHLESLFDEAESEASESHCDGAGD